MTPEAETDIAVRLARLEEQFSAARHALAIQTGELARRLDDLNHAARRREERDATFVPRETYETTMRGALAVAEAREKRVMALERWQSMVVGGMLLAMAIGLVNFIKLFQDR